MLLILNNKSFKYAVRWSSKSVNHTKEEMSLFHLLFPIIILADLRMSLIWCPGICHRLREVLISPRGEVEQARVGTGGARNKFMMLKAMLVDDDRNGKDLKLIYAMEIPIPGIWALFLEIFSMLRFEP
jgi:hypothetical protein